MNESKWDDARVRLLRASQASHPIFVRQRNPAAALISQSGWDVRDDRDDRDKRAKEMEQMNKRLSSQWIICLTIVRRINDAPDNLEGEPPVSQHGGGHAITGG